MDGDQLIELMRRRRDVLTELLKFCDAQVAAIDSDRMTDLMRTLSDKQPLINQLSLLAGPLCEAVGDDPATRIWSSPEQRQQCRQWQDECDAMHQELLATEAVCELKLDVSRSKMQQKLQRVTSGRDAVNRYAQTQATRPAGGSLDLSSN
jgi:Mg2+ and Co2+ transporter CorA